MALAFLIGHGSPEEGAGAVVQGERRKKRMIKSCEQQPSPHHFVASLLGPYLSAGMALFICLLFLVVPWQPKI